MELAKEIQTQVNGRPHYEKLRKKHAKYKKRTFSSLRSNVLLGALASRCQRRLFFI